MTTTYQEGIEGWTETLGMWQGWRETAPVKGWESRMRVIVDGKDVISAYDTTFADFIRNWADTLESDPGLLVRLAVAMDGTGRFEEEQGAAGTLVVTVQPLPSQPPAV